MPLLNKDETGNYFERPCRKIGAEHCDSGAYLSATMERTLEIRACDIMSDVSIEYSGITTEFGRACTALHIPSYLVPSDPAAKPEVRPSGELAELLSKTSREKFVRERFYLAVYGCRKFDADLRDTPKNATDLSGHKNVETSPAPGKPSSTDEVGGSVAKPLN